MIKNLILHLKILFYGLLLFKTKVVPLRFSQMDDSLILEKMTFLGSITLVLDKKDM